MRKSLSSPKQTGARSTKNSPPATVGIRPRRWRKLAAGAAVLVALGGGIAVRWWQKRAAVAPAPPAATALQPTEVRLLAEAGREPANPRPYLSLADEYASSGRRASALWAYTEAEARAPTDDTIHLKLALALRQLADPASAATRLRALIGVQGPAAPSARLELADLLLSTGQPKEALAVLPSAGPEAELARGRAQQAVGDLTAAEQSYRSAGASGDPEGYERLARLELAAGRAAAAREALRTLIRMHSSRAADLHLDAAVQAAAGTPAALDDALRTLLICVKQQPGDAEAYYQAGLIFLRKGDRTAALDQFKRAVKLDPGHAEARRRLADLLVAMGRTGPAHLERAAYYELKDQPDRALAELRLAGAAGDKDDLERTLAVVRVSSELQQLSAALKEAEVGLKRHPGDSHLMLQLGLLCQHPLGGSRATLERLFRDWTAQQPASGMPYWLLGRLDVTESHMDEAIPLLRTACTKEPNRADFCTSLGVAYLTQSTPQSIREARVWLEKAVALNPRLPVPHRHLGRVLEQTGDLEGARRQYLLSLDIQPDQAGVYSSLAQLSARLRRPDAVRLFAELARVEEQRTREREALERRARARPADGAVRIELARWLIRNGQLEAAQNQLERAAESESSRALAGPLLAETKRLLAVRESS